MRRASSVGMTSSVTRTSGTHAGLAESERGRASRKPTIANRARIAGQRASGFGDGFVETVIVPSDRPELQACDTLASTAAGYQPAVMPLRYNRASAHADAPPAAE